MTRAVVTLDSSSPLLVNPESDEAKVQNLMLNMMGGLEYKHLSQDEKDLLKKFGYEHDKENA